MYVCKYNLEDIRAQNIDKFTGRGRIHERFWQHKLDTFTPWGLNASEVEIQ